MRLLIFAMFALLQIASIKAQKVSFHPDPKEVELHDSMLIVQMKFEVEGLKFGESATITFQQPINNQLKLGEHYRFVGPVTQLIRGNNNQGQIEIELFQYLSETTQDLHIPGSVKIGSRKLKFFSTDLIVHYKPSNPRTIGVASTSSLPSSGGNSGSSVIGSLSFNIDRIESEYNCRKTPNKPSQLVQPKTLRASLRPIYSKVILNNEGLVKNGTAANLSVDNGIDVSANYQKSIAEKSFYKFGFNTKVKNGIGDIYSKKKFKNEFGLSFGVTQIIGKPGRFFKEEDCDQLEKERKRYEVPLKYLYNEYSKIDTTALKGRIHSYDSLYEFNASGNFSLSKHYGSLLDSATDSLKTVKELHKAIQKLGSESIIRDSISAWEIRKAVEWSGYQISWLDYDLKLPFTGYYLYDALKKNDTSRYVLMGSMNASITYNHVHYGPKLMWYVYGGIQALLDRGILAIPVSDTISMKSGDQTNIYYKVTNNDWYKLYIFGLSPSLSSILFFGNDKIFGIEAGFSYKYFFYSKVPESKNNIVNARAGILLSLNGEDNISKGTLGLFAQLVDYKKADGPIGENIGIGVRIGVPFNRLFKTN